MNTIEFLEEKIKDLEKKTEFQELKHEEILLEMESLRAKRERVVPPLCPQCSSQTIQLYYTQQNKVQSSYLTTKLMHHVDCQTSLSYTNKQTIDNNNKIDKDCNTDSIPKIITKDKELNVNLLTYDPSLPKLDKQLQTTEIIENIQKMDIKNLELFICKYSYNPLEQSPNENPEAELPLCLGEYVFILSNLDEDGFYIGQLLDGRRGLVPSNFIEKCTNLTKDKYQEIVNEPINNKLIITHDNNANTIQACTNSNLQMNTLNKTSSINIPFPINLNIEKCAKNDSIIVKWDQPSINDFNNSISLKSSIDLSAIIYNVYVNHELYYVVKPTELRAVLIEKLDLNIVCLAIFLFPIVKIITFTHHS
jgi:hypothetical protein